MDLTTAISYWQDRYECESEVEDQLHDALLADLTDDLLGSLEDDL